MSREIAELSKALARHGYRCPEPGVFLREFEPDWTVWLGYINSGWTRRRVSMGLLNTEFLNRSIHALQAYAGPYNEVKPVPHHHPIFMADELRVRSVLGIGKDALERPLERLAQDISEIYDPFVSSCATFEKCLVNLELFSQGLPFYASNKLVLLRLLGRHVEFEELASAWLGSRESQSTSPSDREFVQRLRHGW